MRGQQISFLSAGVRPPSPADVEGLLFGPGQLVRMGGTARLSALLGAADGAGGRADAAAVADAAGVAEDTMDVAGAGAVPTIDPELRAATLIAELAARGIGAERLCTADGAVEVRTPFVAVLRPVADRWVRGAVKAPPARFALDGARLRLWAIGAGAPDGRGYLFAVARRDPQLWQAAGAAFAAAGVPGTFLKSRAGGPAYRIIGRRRLGRLAELVGEPPPGWSAADWPI